MAGFELTLRRKVSHYIITYYLPSGMFVIVSWISFLVPPDIVPGRMTLLVTVFLVLVNIFNTITTNIPKAEGLTAIEAWVIVCVLFVFGALIEYAGLLLKMKLATTRRCRPPGTINIINAYGQYNVCGGGTLFCKLYSSNGYFFSTIFEYRTWFSFEYT